MDYSSSLNRTDFVSRTIVKERIGRESQKV